MMSYSYKQKDNIKEEEQFNSINKWLKDKKLNPKKSNDLKYLLYLTLKPEIKKFNIDYLLIFLSKYLNSENDSIFYEFLFQSCELGKLNNVKILLNNGLSVNCQNDLGETPLHIAIAKNDFELIKLLIKYEPDTTLSTDKDNFTAMNYAEIQGNKSIIKIIYDLNEKNMIKSEIIDYINKDMSKINNIEIDDISSYMRKDNDFEEIEKYNGEKISILENEEASNSINKEESNSINNKNHVNKNVNKNSNKKIRELKNNKDNITLTVLKESDLCEDISPKKTIKISNYNNKINFIDNKNISKNIAHRFLTEDFTCDMKIPKRHSTEIKILTSPIKKKDELNNYYNNSSINPSCVQSLTTSHTINHEQIESALIANKTPKSIDKKTELINFIEEINLPKQYADILLDNGFDDLELLILQTKNGVALTDQNLKVIGINPPGSRAKILIHLEELAGKFPFLLEKKIYCNEIIMNNNSSLYQFLSSINLEEYIEIFRKNGYYNAELMYIQMVCENPITEDMLKKDFSLNEIELIKRIILNLNDCSKNYVKSIKKRNVDNKIYKSIVYEGNPCCKACDTCIII